jgi:hypothetical protein
MLHQSSPIVPPSAGFPDSGPDFGRDAIAIRLSEDHSEVDTFRLRESHRS